MVSVGGDDAVLHGGGCLDALDDRLLSIVAVWICVIYSVVCQDGAYRWQKPRIILALYIMSAAISMRRMMYMLRKYWSSSALLVVTWLPGGSTRCALKGVTCVERAVCPNPAHPAHTAPAHCCRHHQCHDLNILSHCTCVRGCSACAVPRRKSSLHLHWQSRAAMLAVQLIQLLRSPPWA